MRKFFVTALLGVATTIGPALAADIVVKTAPPAAVVEERGVAPGPNYVWVPGYHRWDGNAYVWEKGRWDVPPRPHAVWVEPRWEHRHGGYVFIQGRWK